MTAIARKNIQIWFAAADTNPVAVASTGTLITGQIKNFEQTGGNTDIESIPHFGGYVDLEKPQSQIEVDMEITPSFESADLWDSLFLYRHSSGVFSFNGTGSALAVFIQATTGSMSKTRAYNNVKPSDFEVSHEADDNQMATVKFKLSPQTTAGIANYQTRSTTIASLSAWSTLS